MRGHRLATLPGHWRAGDRAYHLLPEAGRGRPERGRRRLGRDRDRRRDPPLADAVYLPGQRQAGPVAAASGDPAERPLDLAVKDLVGDGLEGDPDGTGGDAVEGGAGGVDLGLGGAAGLGEGG
jgi:hypothetical protein